MDVHHINSVSYIILTYCGVLFDLAMAEEVSYRNSAPTPNYDNRNLGSGKVSVYDFSIIASHHSNHTVNYRDC